MRNPNLLFFENDLDSQLRSRQQKVSRAVDDIPEQQFLISNDQELVDHIVAGLTVEPLMLREEAVVNQGYLRISISLPHDAEPESFKETTSAS